MATIELSEDTFQGTVTKPGITFVDWWASWCGPCRMFAPVYEAASGKHPDITFAKVDTEAEPRLAATANIKAIPTVMVFYDGILVFNQAGVFPAPSLEQLIEEIRGLDMDDVRRQVAERAAGQDGSASASVR